MSRTTKSAVTNFAQKSGYQIALAGILVLAFSVHAYRIDVDVAETLTGSFVFVNYTTTSGLVNVSTEFYNNGSVSYDVRLRLDLYHESGLTSLWSDERVLAPGGRSFFSFLWHPDGKNVTARLRAYFGGEVLDSGETDLGELKSATTDAFAVSNVRTYENRIEFIIVPNADTAVVVAPVKHPRAWVFGNIRLGILKNQSTTSVSLPYKAPLWSPETVTLSVFSEDGNYYSEKQIKLVRPADKPDLFRLLSLLFTTPLALFS